MKDIQRLAASAEQQAALIDDVVEFTREHERFYQILAEVCSNATLSMFVRILRELMHAQTEMIGNALMYGGEEALKGRRAHVRAKEKLVELLRGRDREATEKWWRRHLRAQLDELVASGRGDVTLKAPRPGGFAE
jgi:DNA-binding GntR family transcriptional regulator